MSVQQYLATVSVCDQQVRRTLAQRAWLQERMQACLDSDAGRHERAVWADRLDALAPRVEDAFMALDQQIRKVRHLIDRLPDPQERTALTLRFVDLLPHERAAEAMHVSVRHLFRIQKRALMHLEGIVG